MTIKIHHLVVTDDDNVSTQLLDGEQLWIPQRLMQSQPRQFLLWTFRQRTVFALVNGKRNIVEIAQMLSISPTKVLQTLHQLQAMPVIAKRRSTHG